MQIKSVFIGSLSAPLCARALALFAMPRRGEGSGVQESGGRGGRSGGGGGGGGGASSSSSSSSCSAASADPTEGLGATLEAFRLAFPSSPPLSRIDPSMRTAAALLHKYKGALELSLGATVALDSGDPMASARGAAAALKTERASNAAALMTLGVTGGLAGVQARAAQIARLVVAPGGGGGSGGATPALPSLAGTVQALLAANSAAHGRAAQTVSETQAWLASDGEASGSASGGEDE
jgi:hypothetical protein